MNPEQTRALVHRLRRLQDATRNGRVALLPEGSVSRLDLLERRLVALVNRALTPGPERDGYPSGHLGGGEDIDYHPDSSTQHAAFTRLERPARDVVYEDAQAAYRHLEAAVNELAALTMRLDKVDDLLAKGNQRHSNMPESCLVCDRTVEGTAVDRLRRGLCDADYRAWLRLGRPDIIEFRRLRQGEAA
jgi:hypothetical protein